MIDKREDGRRDGGVYDDTRTQRIECQGKFQELVFFSNELIGRVLKENLNSVSIYSVSFCDVGFVCFCD